jgi:hypothetical protein
MDATVEKTILQYFRNYVMVGICGVSQSWDMPRSQITALLKRAVKEIDKQEWAWTAYRPSEAPKP